MPPKWGPQNQFFGALAFPTARYLRVGADTLPTGWKLLLHDELVVRGDPWGGAATGRSRTSPEIDIVNHVGRGVARSVAVGKGRILIEQLVLR